MTNRLFGIDVSHYQDPAAPAGFTYKAMRAKSSFAIVRMTYGKSPDDRSLPHITNARKEAYQVGGYHFLVLSQPIEAQLDVFLAQMIRCGVGKGDIAPALDCEDDGKSVLTRAAEPLIHRACDILCSEFGTCLPYINQAGWIALGEPKWMLDLPLWIANYTNGPKPFLPAAIWQNRVGPYAPGAPFVRKEAYVPNAIDQDVCDGDLPLATLDPSHPRTVDPIPASHPDQGELWQRRLDALTTSAYQGLDLDHSQESGEAYDDEPTVPDNKIPT